MNDVYSALEVLEQLIFVLYKVVYFWVGQILNTVIRLLAHEISAKMLKKTYCFDDVSFKIQTAC